MAVTYGAKCADCGLPGRALYARLRRGKIVRVCGACKKRQDDLDRKPGRVTK
jgi:hypothetical protein